MSHGRGSGKAVSATESAWLVRPVSELYYVLVYVSKLAEQGTEPEPDQFVVLTQEEVVDLGVQSSHSNDPNKIPGFAWRDPHRFRDALDKLPR